MFEKSKLRKKLAWLKENCSMVGIKGGTEVEDLNYKEIAFLRKISQGIMPLTVKIGGPEARTDIRFMIENNIDTVLAPMVESVYGLKNFIDCSKEMETYYGKTIQKAINMETITAYQHMDEIYGSVYFKELRNVTVGRSDFSGSMGKSVDDPEVMKMTSDFVHNAKKLGKFTSVGGKITVKNIENIKKVIAPDVINTRHIVFDIYQGNDLNKSLIEGLMFEIELYKAFKKLSPSKRKAYEARIEDSLKRAGLGG